MAPEQLIDDDQHHSKAASLIRERGVDDCGTTASASGHNYKQAQAINQTDGEMSAPTVDRD